MSPSQEKLGAPRIGQATDIGVTTALFSVAIITYAIRTYIRLRVMKRFLVDDYLLLFTVTVLIALTGVNLAAVRYEYDALIVMLGGVTPGLIIEILGEIPMMSRLENTTATLWWFVIIPVKLAFAVFFRRIVNRVRSLRFLCDFVIGFSILAGVICVAVSWMTCPYFETAGIISCSNPDGVYRVLRDTGITTAFDIISDALLVSIPIIILQRTHIKIHQKLMIAIPLCLSLVMVIVAVIRMAAIKLEGGAVDIVWLTFWSQQECSIAVIMISVSAFRSFFVYNSSKRRTSQWPQNSYSSRQWTPSWKPGRWSSSADSNRTNRPEIPSATLTGMRTFIDEAGDAFVRFEAVGHEEDGSEPDELLPEP